MTPAYIFGLAPLPPPKPHLIFHTADPDDGGFAVSIPIFQRDEFGIPSGDIAIALAANSDLSASVQAMVHELFEVTHDGPDAAEQVEDAIAADEDTYAFAWEGVRFAHDNDAYVFPAMSVVVDADERAALRAFMKLVIAQLRDDSTSSQES